MGKSFYESSGEVRDLFQKAEETVGIPLTRYLFDGPEETLTRTDVTQPAICLVSLAALKMATARGLSAAAACGHSLGEYAALVSAGVISDLDALRVVARRGRAMQEAAGSNTPGKMAAIVGLGFDAMERALAGLSGVQIAAQNAPDQIVISGESAGVDAAIEKMKAAGAKNGVVLKTSGAWHSHLMAPAQPALREAIAKTEIRAGRFPVIANATAEPFPTDRGPLQDLLVRQLTSPIRFVECLQRMRAMGVEAFVELGPGKVLRGLVKKLDRSIPAYAIEDPASLEDAAKALTAGRV